MNSNGLTPQQQQEEDAAFQTIFDRFAPGICYDPNDYLIKTRRLYDIFFSLWLQILTKQGYVDWEEFLFHLKLNFGLTHVQLNDLYPGVGTLNEIPDKVDNEHIFLFLYTPESEESLPASNLFEFYKTQTLLVCVKKNMTLNQLKQLIAKNLEIKKPRFKFSTRHLGLNKDKITILDFSKTLDEQGVKNLSLLILHNIIQ